MRPLLKPDEPPELRPRLSIRPFRRRKTQPRPGAHIGQGKDKDPWGLWRGPLIGTFGAYCAYCEIPVEIACQVEHKVPKNIHQGNPNLDANWSNLLPACGPCNRAKHESPPQDKRDEYLWPDESEIWFSPIADQSSFAYALVSVGARRITYDKDNVKQTEGLGEKNVVIVKPGGVAAEKAKKTIGLCKLNGTIDTKNKPQAQWMHTVSANYSDRRVEYRTAAWTEAVNAAARLKTIYDECPDKQNDGHMALRSDMEHLVTCSAVATGFWSVWLTVFHNETLGWGAGTLSEADRTALLHRLFVVAPPHLRNTELCFPGTNEERTYPNVPI